MNRQKKPSLPSKHDTLKAALKPRPKCANKRNDAEKQRDSEFVEDLRLKKFTLSQITRKFNERPGIGYTLSLQQIALDLTKVEAKWEDARQDAREKWLARELASLDTSERELWEEWARSKQDSESKRIKGIANNQAGGVTPVEVVKTQDGQCGDVRYQSEINSIRKLRAEYLGLYAPKKTEMQMSGNMVVVQAPFNPEDVTGPAPTTPPDN